MSDPFLPEEETSAVKARTTISLDADRLKDVKNIADFWNEYAEIHGRRRVPKWKNSSVIERMVNAQLDAFWHQVGVTSAEETPAERKQRLDAILTDARAKKAREQRKKG